MTEKVKSITGYLLNLLQVISLIGMFFMWVDARYMHSEIANTRYVDLQIKITQSNIREYNRIKEMGVMTDPSDDTQYVLDLKELQLLMAQRNKILGLE